MTRLTDIVESWRVRCPYGHTHLVDQQGPTAYCKGCREAYRYGDLVDAREADAPALVADVDHRSE
ncbi:hypothetical protein EGH21_21530 [Halomicroarcula sp. F13]|uniref:Uncharacterized protein n=1 Tax=Haloarcula rubra TaxID=2487747 RepID=A0AAW4PX39_9EURY|nr:hypothetical protein [Halomicroarcula rubra]MBX0325608.1 hypothetical protein [Halomicroarcula rubra]